MMDEIIDKANSNQGNYGNVELMPDAGEHFHVFTKFDTNPGKKITPDQ